MRGSGLRSLGLGFDGGLGLPGLRLLVGVGVVSRFRFCGQIYVLESCVVTRVFIN